jgi:hypothetical protein
LGFGVRVILEEHFDCGIMSALCSEVQWCIAFRIFRLDVSAILEKQPNCSLMSVQGSEVQRCDTQAVSGVDISTLLEQQLHSVFASAPGCVQQGISIPSVTAMDTSTTLEQQRDRILTLVLGCLSQGISIMYSGTRVFGARSHRAKERPTFFSHTTRNAKICIFHYTANIFLRKLHRIISDDLLSLPPHSKFISIVVVEV